MSTRKRIYEVAWTLAMAVLVMTPIAQANLLTNGDFEIQTDPKYPGPIPSSGIPVEVGSAVWDSEVVDAWVRGSDHCGWRAPDPTGTYGTVINLRKQANGFMQAVDAAGIVPGTELTLRYKLYLLPEADDAATIWVRLMALNTGSSRATLVNPGPVDSMSNMVIGSSENINELGLANTAVAGAPREQWIQVEQTMVFPGGYDYLVVFAGYANAANTNNYLVDEFELLQPPLVAHAGFDQSVLDANADGFHDITLDGTYSGATDSTIVSYEWTEDGSTIATGVTPTVTFPVGSHDVMLTVTDDTGATASDTVVIDILTSAPVADAGPDQRLADEDRDGSEPVSLDGTGSTDPNGTIDLYIWFEGETFLAFGANAEITLPVGEHTLTLEVQDNERFTDTDTVVVNVREVPVLAGNEISDYKSGITLTPLGVYGLDYLVENTYHDQAIDPSCTIYIKDYVPLEMIHNAMNVLVDDIVGADGPGRIRYRVDQNMSRRAKWAGYERLWPQYTEPISFAEMDYDPGAPVVGVTGALPGVSWGDPYNFYWRGMVGPFGDEWHVIAVGDDDEDPDLYYDGWASDGKVYEFVLNPTTPCLSLIANDASAQWYTTAPKAYFVPKIHAQTTYLLGDIDIELAALDAAPVEYSLRVEGDSADIWTPYTAAINTVAEGLTADTRYELRYRIGSDGTVKTRVLHFDPAYPSDAEQHPTDILWKGETGLQRIRDRINDDAPERQVYRDVYDSILNNPWYHRRGYDTFIDGFRKNNHGLGLLCNSFPLLIDGFDQHAEAAEFLHERMLDNVLNLDPVGVEGNHSQNNPCKELNYQGYYSMTSPLAMALSYDWVIKEMRAGVHPYGFTAIEDYKMRDMLAAFCLHTALRYVDDYAIVIDENGYDLGMWTTAWLVGANIISAIMPEYDSSLYGSSGAPTGSSGVGGAWTPFPDYPVTWWDLATDKEIDIPGPPNMAKRSGFWGLLNEDVEWADRRGYWDGHMMGWLYYLNSNFRANYDGHHYAHFETAYDLIMDGLLEPGKYPTEGPLHHYSALLINHNFPTLAAKADAGLSAGVAVNETDIPTSVSYHHVLGLCLYEDDYATVTDAKPGDADGDNDVDLSDFVILKTHFGLSEGATVSEGDFDGDGDVDLSDFVILKTNFGT